MWLDYHLTNEHRTILHVASLAAHTTLNTYKPMEINIERSPLLGHIFEAATISKHIKYS